MLVLRPESWWRTTCQHVDVLQSDAGETIEGKRRPSLAIQTFTGDAGFWFDSVHAELLERCDRHLRARSFRTVRQLGKVLPTSLPFGHRMRRGRVLVLTSWAKSHRFFPYSWWREPVVYAIDCWPKDWDRWEALLRRSGVRIAMFSARGSAEEMARRIPGLRTFWVPEFVDPGLYRSSMALADRAVDLMVMGRRYEPFDDAIAADGRTAPLHQAAPAGVPHPELRALMGQSKMLVCFPRTMTHPEKAGGLETMTLRYLEAIAAGCVVVGVAPQELIDLFGYDPVVDASDPSTAPNVVSHVAKMPAEYQDLIERNLARLHEVGTAVVRAKEIVDLARIAR